MSLAQYTPTTELEAVNAVLAALNEAPVASLEEAAGRPDVALAQDALHAAIRETMAERWRFNSDTDFRLMGEPLDGGYVYPTPSGLVAFDVTPREEQRDLDLVARPSRTYRVNGQAVSIITNRIGGSDTLTADVLYINPVWFVPFNLAPEAARRYIVRSAVRRRVQQTVGVEAAQTAAADEQAALIALQQSERPQGRVQLSDGWADETDALNAVLANAGREPVAHAYEARGEQLAALNLIREAVRTVCAEGWRFNTDLGRLFAPDDSLDWTDRDGTLVPLNIFSAPDNLMSVVPALMPEQDGSRWIDPVIRVAETYAPGGVRPRVIADRANVRDGWPVDRPYLYLDCVWRIPFADLPEPARRYVTLKAARQFAASLEVNPRWTAADEADAYSTLRRLEGRRERLNMFARNPTMRAVRGGRNWRNW